MNEITKKQWQAEVTKVQVQRDAIIAHLNIFFGSQFGNKRSHYGHHVFNCSEWRITISVILSEHKNSPCYWVTLRHTHHPIDIQINLNNSPCVKEIVVAMSQMVVAAVIMNKRIISAKELTLGAKVTKKNS